MITKNFFNVICLEMNKEKSASNTPICQEYTSLLANNQCYKYLGICENSKSEVSEETLLKIKKEIYNRTEKLCKTKLNAKNLIKSINEYALSVMNYYIGAVNIEPEEFKKIDENIRLILNKHKIHLQPACEERLYLSREKLWPGH